MITKKDFYFIRHGQTDYNKNLEKIDHEDISLNEIGQKQAYNMRSLLTQIRPQRIYCSPKKRAKETKEILLPNTEHVEMAAFGECTAKIWHEMVSLKRDAYLKGSLETKNFLERVKGGLNEVLEEKGPILIVSHGGVHFAMCHWMCIIKHNWVVDNCRLVHFLIDTTTGLWKAKTF